MKAALLTAYNEPLAVSDVFLDRIDYGQVRVKVLASGICGAQLQEIRGEKKGAPLPHLLGHEGVGIVIESGVGVTRVKSGDKVVLHWRKAGGIESPFPRYLVGKDSARYNTPAFMNSITSGKVVTFAEEVFVSENRVTPVPLETPNELCSLLGCGLSTALGTMENEARLSFGESVLILGVGGLGCNLIRAAGLRQAAEIVTVDLSPDKGPLALQLGATEYFTAVPSGRRFDVVVDTTGHPDAISAGLQALGPSGRFVMVGQPAPLATVPLVNARHMFDGEGKSIRATQGGGFRPEIDIPRYVALHKAGRLNLDGIISDRIPLADINRGINLVRKGGASRVLIEMT